MAVNWVDGTTPVNAANLNAMEDEIEEVRGGVDELKSTVDELSSYSSYTFNTTTPITDQVEAIPYRQFIAGIILSASNWQECEMPSNANYFVFAIMQSASQGQIIALRMTAPTIYIRAKASGTWGDWVQLH